VWRTQDFHGQKLSEDMYQIIIALFSAVAFVAGYTQECAPSFRQCPSFRHFTAALQLLALTRAARRRARSFALMMKVFAVGVAVAFVLCVPPWPFMNRHPLKWRKKGDATAAAQQAGGGGGGGGGGRGGGRGGRGGGGAKQRKGGNKRCVH
jgi:uncharacterized membrane protein YgcG